MSNSYQKPGAGLGTPSEPKTQNHHDDEKRRDDEDEFVDLFVAGKEKDKFDKEVKESEAEQVWLGPRDLNTLIHRTLNIPFKGVNEEKERQFFTVDIEKQPWVIFKTTSDSPTKGNAPFLTEALSNFKKTQKPTGKFLIPAVQSSKGDGHVVLVEGDFDTGQTRIHDSQGRSHIFYKGPLISALKAAGLKDPEYHAYGKQDKSFECGFFVHQFMQDILFNKRELLPNIKVIDPKKVQYLEEYSKVEGDAAKTTELIHLNRARNKICAPIIFYLKNTILFHSDRAKAVVSDIQKADSLDEIKIILEQQRGFFENPKDKFKNDQKYSTFFNTAPKRTDKGEFYAAIVSALKECNTILANQVAPRQQSPAAPRVGS